MVVKFYNIMLMSDATDCVSECGLSLGVRERERGHNFKNCGR